MSLDFTLGKYAQLCETIQRLACPVMTIKAFLETGQPKKFIVVLRHDVDRNLPSAIRMAELEASYDLQATYYMRKTRAVFKAPQMKYLNQLGHEVGYHYETLNKAYGNSQRAMNIFSSELQKFRQIVPVDTISMHGSPLMPWNNLDLWQTHNFSDYNLLGEAYLSVDYSQLFYFTDTGRSWAAGRYNIRDRVNSQRSQAFIESSDDLIAFLNKKPDCPVLINTHPNRWTTGKLAWAVSATYDFVVNRAKWLIASIYQQG